MDEASLSPRKFQRAACGEKVPKSFMRGTDPGFEMEAFEGNKAGHPAKRVSRFCF